MNRLIAESKRSKELNGKNGAAEDSADESDEEQESGSDDNSDAEAEEESDRDDFSDLVYDSDSESELERSKNLSLKNSSQSKLKSSLTKTNASKPFTEEDRKAMMEKAQKELPYTFELCSKYDELEKLLKKYNPDYQAVILERMIKCNHPKVEPANREKMTTLFAFLLQYINDLATENDIHNCFAIVDRITPFLYDLSHINPAETTKCFLDVIKEKQSDFRKSSKTYPKLDTLIFLKIVSSLYSTSDFRHTIVSPCTIFISQILSHSRIENRSDISSGLFIVSIILEYTQLSKRFLPDTVNLLAGVLFLCIRKHSIQRIKVVPPFKEYGEFSSLLVLKKPIKVERELRLLVTDLCEIDIDDSFRIRAFNAAVLQANELLSRLEVNALQQLAEPFLKYLDKIDLTNYPAKVKENASMLTKTIERINSQPLTYLVPEVKKPKALRQLEPKFERIYDDKRDRFKNAGKSAERKGLERKIKRETKGAVREIRRDNAFLSKVQLKRKLQRYVLMILFVEIYIHSVSVLYTMSIFTNNFSFCFIVMLNVRRKSNVYMLKLQYSKVNLMLLIERRNIYK